MVVEGAVGTAGLFRPVSACGFTGDAQPSGALVEALAGLTKALSTDIGQTNAVDGGASKPDGRRTNQVLVDHRAMVRIRTDHRFAGHVSWEAVKEVRGATPRITVCVIRADVVACVG
jgi:hypothetical protein